MGGGSSCWRACRTVRRADARTGAARPQDVKANLASDQIMPPECDIEVVGDSIRARERALIRASSTPLDRRAAGRPSAVAARIHA
jgi:hypothetical protein